MSQTSNSTRPYEYVVFTDEVEFFFPSPPSVVSLHHTMEEAEKEVKRLTDEFDGDVQWWWAEKITSRKYGERGRQAGG